MNKLIVLGRLVRDSEVRFLQNGKPVLSFSLANNTGWGDNQKTNFFDCALFGKQAEGKLQDSLKKGTLVLVDGEVSLNTYQKQDGTSNASLRVMVNNVELIGGQRNEYQPRQAQQRPQQRPEQNNHPNYGPNYVQDDDIPF